MMYRVCLRKRRLGLSCQCVHMSLKACMARTSSFPARRQTLGVDHESLRQSAFLQAKSFSMVLQKKTKNKKSLSTSTAQNIPVRAGDNPMVNAVGNAMVDAGGNLMPIERQAIMRQLVPCCQQICERLNRRKRQLTSSGNKKIVMMKTARVLGENESTTSSATCRR